MRRLTYPALIRIFFSFAAKLEGRLLRPSCGGPLDASRDASAQYSNAEYVGDGALSASSVPPQSERASESKRAQTPPDSAKPGTGRHLAG